MLPEWIIFKVNLCKYAKSQSIFAGKWKITRWKITRLHRIDTVQIVKTSCWKSPRRQSRLEIQNLVSRLYVQHTVEHNSRRYGKFFTEMIDWFELCLPQCGLITLRAAWGIPISLGGAYWVTISYGGQNLHFLILFLTKYLRKLAILHDFMQFLMFS